MLLRLLIYGFIIAVIVIGVRRILKDWSDRFRSLDKEQHARDVKERARPDVLELKRGEDGVYRPGGDAGKDD